MFALRRGLFLWLAGVGALTAFVAAWMDARFGSPACTPWDIALGIVLGTCWLLGRWRRAWLPVLARIIFAFVIVFFLGVIPHEIVRQPEFLLWLPFVPLITSFFFGPREGAAWALAQGTTAFPSAFLHLPVGRADVAAMVTIGLLAYLFFAAVSLAIAALLGRYEVELRKRMEQRIRMQRRLAETERQRVLALVAAGVAHDFNNLLFGVIGNLELALADLPPGHPARRQVERATAEAERAAEDVRKLREATGRMHIRRESVRLEDIVRRAMRLLAQAAPEAEVRLRVQSRDVRIMGDSALLARALFNLLLNAAEANRSTDHHEVLVEIGEGTKPPTDTALPALSTAPHWGWVRIADHGAGIAEEAMAHLFDPFFTTKPAGTGLGLAAVAGIVRSHGGAVEVESRPDAGATFTLWLPAAD